MLPQGHPAHILGVFRLHALWAYCILGVPCICPRVCDFILQQLCRVDVGIVIGEILKPRP